MPADRLQRLHEKLQSVDCPRCHRVLTSLILRCDAYMGSECLALSQCGHCGAWVDIESAPTIEEEFREVVKGALAAGCQTCRSRELRVEYRCDLVTRECFYETVCRPAGHQHRL